MTYLDLGVVIFGVACVMLGSGVLERYDVPPVVAYSVSFGWIFLAVLVGTRITTYRERHIPWDDGDVPSSDDETPI